MNHRIEALAGGRELRRGDVGETDLVGLVVEFRLAMDDRTIMAGATRAAQERISTVQGLISTF